MCAMSTVTKPRFKNFTKSSMSDIPVTISAFNSGMLVAPSISVVPRFFIALMPMAASVPISVESTAAQSVICSVMISAFMIVLSVKQEAYHFKVNPPHTTLDLELLKERTTKTRIGRYKNKKMTAR